MNVGLDILIIFFLILLNGLFALSETAILASRHARLQQRANEGDANALKALNLAERPNRFLPTVQVGITLIGVLTGAVGGAVFRRFPGSPDGQDPGSGTLFPLCQPGDRCHPDHLLLHAGRRTGPQTAGITRRRKSRLAASPVL